MKYFKIISELTEDNNYLKDTKIENKELLYTGYAKICHIFISGIYFECLYAHIASVTLWKHVFPPSYIFLVLNHPPPYPINIDIELEKEIYLLLYRPYVFALQR